MKSCKNKNSKQPISKTKRAKKSRVDTAYYDSDFDLVKGSSSDGSDCVVEDVFRISRVNMNLNYFIS